MKNTETDDQWLNELLEQPAVLRGRSFIEPVKQHMERIEKIRRRIFLGAAFCWMVTLWLAMPAQFLTNSLQRISSFSSATEGLIQWLMNLDPVTFATQSGNPTILFVFLLGAYALASLQLRNL